MSAIAACLAENGQSAVFSFQAIEAMDHPPNATAQPDERMAEVGWRERALECPDVGRYCHHRAIEPSSGWSFTSSRRE